MNPSAVLVSAALALLAGALILALFRLLRGPSLPDRAVALDLIGLIVAGLVGVFAVTSGEDAMLDVLLVLALFVFLGTVAVARYLEQGGRP
jgi:multicomponent Na+:H+ antiporter subunit F